MSDQTVQSRDINVASVFQDFYVVPDYQREYVWGSEEVEQLLELVRREGAEQSRRTPLDHVMACPSCRHEFDLLRAVEQAGVESGARPRARWQWRNLAPVGL